MNDNTLLNQLSVALERYKVEYLKCHSNSARLIVMAQAQGYTEAIAEQATAQGAEAARSLHEKWIVKVAGKRLDLS